MASLGEREEKIRQLMINTRTRRRQDNLLAIADMITWLEKDLGGINKVAEHVRVSSQMLRKFLAVNELPPSLKELVRKRLIDSVTVVHLMKHFDRQSQLYIGQSILSGNLSIDTLRALVPLHRRHKHKPIRELTTLIEKTKSVKVYAVKIPSDLNSDQVASIKRRLIKYTGQQGIRLRSTTDGRFIEFTESGIKIIGTEAKRRNLSKGQFISKIILGPLHD